MKTIAFALQKGGSGKTTTCLNLGAAMAEMGQRVLLVDLDPQANLTSYLGMEPDSQKQTIYTTICEIIRDGTTENPPPILQTEEGVGLVPSNLDLALAELDLQNTIRREYVLSKALKLVSDEYDYCFVDCPPSLGILVVNALTMADSVIIPVQAEYFAAKGIDQLLHLMQRIIRTELNPELRVEGILLTMATQRTLHGREIIETVRELYRDLKVFETVISRSIRFPESAAEGKSVFRYTPAKAFAEDFRALAREVLGNG